MFVGFLTKQFQTKKIYCLKLDSTSIGNSEGSIQDLCSAGGGNRREVKKEISGHQDICIEKLVF